MNTFADYWKSLTNREKLELAEKADSSYAHLTNIANGHKEFRRADELLPFKLVNADKNITYKMCGLEIKEEQVK